MCGIFGIISDSTINIQKLIKVNNVIKHRGPDDEGYMLVNSDTIKYYKGIDSPPDINLPDIKDADQNEIFTIALIHRRLSIIDLSSFGHQPMNCLSRYSIVFNGEIYNYIELKEILVKKGYFFNTNSDTEVICAAYDCWGTDSVNYFNGMWAFAIWDNHNKSLFISRDRFGVKPFFYSLKEGEFIFCSEIKGIREYQDKKSPVNESKIFNYILNGKFYIGESDETMFYDIRQLMPSTNLVWKNGKITMTKYYDLVLNKNSFPVNKNIEIFQELFYNSIKYRLRSDIEVGSCLSGGIDSSSIVTFINTVFKKNLHTFSAVWPGDENDESVYIEKVNNKYANYPHYFNPDFNKIEQIIDQVIWHQEIPIPGSSLLAQWWLMEEASINNIHVLLDGQGADEILAGYPRYIPTLFIENLRNLKFNSLINNYRSYGEKGYNPIRVFLKKYLTTPFITSYIPLKNTFVKNRITNPILQYNTIFELLKSEITSSNLPALLHFEDRNSMAFSVESRVPFLDYNLVSFSVNLPSCQLYAKGSQKYFLREAMKPYLPNEIYQRRDKIGFTTPIEKNIFNLNSVFGKKVFKEIRNSKIGNLDLIDFDKIENKHLFKIYSLYRFLKIWNN